MREVLWHGRGGQGAFTAARLLGAAASLADGKYALAFPSFGPERRGAPMRAFTKMDTRLIGDRSACEVADYVIYLDDTLFGPGWETELKPGAKVLVNSADLLIAKGDPRVLAIDANGISSEILGRPIPNTVFLGALTQLTDAVSLEDVEQAIRLYMPAKLHEKNIAIVAKAAEVTQELLAASVGASSAEAAAPVAADQADAAPAVVEPEPAVTVPSEPAPNAPAEASSKDLTRRPSILPTLRAETPQITEAAKNTCFDAGHLRAKNAGWRNHRPVIDPDLCMDCLKCYLDCPDGAIFKPAERALSPDGEKEIRVAIDLDFCKGCGMCAKACKFKAIQMIPEKEA